MPARCNTFGVGQRRPLRYRGFDVPEPPPWLRKLGKVGAVVAFFAAVPTALLDALASAVGPRSPWVAALMVLVLAAVAFVVVAVLASTS